MNGLHKRLKVLLIFGVFILFAACSRGAARQAGAGYDSSSYQYESKEAAVVDYRKNTSRKFIITASLTLQLTDLKNCENTLNEILDRYDAYTTETSTYNNMIYYTVKIPADAYGECFEEIKKIGKIVALGEIRKDVTLDYYDIESRLNTQRELMKKYQEYLGKAANIEEIMAVERQIAELQNEIDKTGTDFTQLNNSIDFSTVDLVLRGPRNDDTYYTETIGEKIKSLIGGFGDYASITVTILAGAVIYGIPSLVIFLLLYLVLFGRIGILKKVWRLLSGKKTRR